LKSLRFLTPDRFYHISKIAFAKCEPAAARWPDKSPGSIEERQRQLVQIIAGLKNSR
jgi:hypothetical protein